MSNPTPSLKNGDYFPYLPPYADPTVGLLVHVPRPLHPYLQLMRLDRPKPALYFYLPHLIGSIQASVILDVRLAHLVRANVALAIGTFFLRGATCCWNDAVDVEFDRKVERTRHRPLARKAISMQAACAFIMLQATVAIAVLARLPPACTLYAVPAVIGWWAYPLSKRVTYYPQLVLGFPMAWGVFMGAAAVGAEPLRLDRSQWQFLVSMANPGMTTDAARAIQLLYLANLAWTLCYETIYSYQDIRDDVKAGVKNIALLLKDQAKIFLFIVAGIQVLSLALAGYLIRARLPYFLGSVGATSFILGFKITSVNLDDPSNCLWWFRDGGYITASAMLSGFLWEYLLLDS